MASVASAINRCPRRSSSATQYETNLLADRLPDQVQAQISDPFYLPVQFDAGLLEVLAVSVEQFDQRKLLAVYPWPAGTTSFRRCIDVGYHIAFGPRHHMDKIVAGVVAHLFEDGKHRSDGKIGVEDQKTPFAQRRQHSSCHGCHQAGHADLGLDLDQWFGLSLECADRFDSFMELGTKRNAEDFF